MGRGTGRSFASAVRVSLFSLSGALGLLALSAGAATADDGGSERGLLGSVASVVESVAAPVGDVVGAVSDSSSEPAASVADTRTLSAAVHPSVSKLVGSIPEVIGDLSVVETVAPVTGVINATVPQMPVVNQVLPGDTATAVTQPVLEAVDTQLEPILAPVGQAVTPVVEALDPVTEVVDAVVEPAVPVIAVPAPVEVPGPVNVPQPEVPAIDSQPEASVVTPLPVVSQTDEALAAGHGDEPPATRSGEERLTAGKVVPATAVSVVSNGGIRGPFGANDPAPVPQPQEAAPSLADADHALPELPTLASGGTTGSIAGGVLPTSAPGSSANSGAGNGVGAADAVLCVNIPLALGNSSSCDAANALLQSPTFDPGSTPD